MTRGFTIAVASGKGGTGKTTIATNLACSIARMGEAVQYLDCDVEEPNGHIFLKPDMEETQDVTIGVPEVDAEECNGCGKCGELCQYSAIICLKDTVMTFEQLCHSCGGCMAICPQGAISEKQRSIGTAEFGRSNGIYFGHGKLNIGAVQTPALIKQVKRKAIDNAVVIIDAPPGTSCPVIEAVKGSDLVLLVTEPTPFGLNDLELAVETVRELKLPFVVAINRCDIGDDRVVRYCRREGIEIVLEMPNDRLAAEAYSRGINIIDALPGYEEKFQQLYRRINAKVGIK
ncbi:MAG TPA: ATP-binding protein [Sedimentisphaerales bacterium]|nr:ATP-binding protein [Sedimentisphaerales bacterium]